MFQQVLRVYNQIQKYTKPLNESKLLAGIFIVLINISSKFVDIRLSKPMEAYFRHTFSRHALVFAIAWMPTRDIFLSLVISAIVIFVIDHLVNDSSPWCALSEQFTGMQLNKEKEREEKELQEKYSKNTENLVPSKEEVEHAIAVIGRIREIGYPTTADVGTNKNKTLSSFTPSSSFTSSSSSIRPANHDIYI